MQPWATLDQPVPAKLLFEHDLFLCPLATHFGFCPSGSNFGVEFSHFVPSLPRFAGPGALFNGVCQGFIRRMNKERERERERERESTKVQARGGKPKVGNYVARLNGCRTGLLDLFNLRCDYYCLNVIYFSCKCHIVVHFGNKLSNN
jgi:hypothetical protein